MIRALCLLLLAGCVHHPAQSWDQANLKRNDHGCPVAIFVAPGGILQQCQLSTHPIALHTYVTAELAAIAALQAVAAKPSGLYYEWGGVIVQLEDQFLALPPNTTYEGDHVAIESNSFAPEAKVIGSYHTHPCLPGHDVEYFSPADLTEALFMHRTVFMGDLCTGNVHEFKPGDKPDDSRPSSDSEDIFLTKGRIIGQFTVAHALMAGD